VIEADVLIVGAGPAGATAALNLAPVRKVVLVERRPRAPPRIGESLLPAARRLLRDMGLLTAFEAEGHTLCYGNRSVWGGPEPVETDFLRDPDGPGWHLDRARFDAWLRAIAVVRGAHLLAPARIEAIAPEREAFSATIKTNTGVLQANARVVIDAGGRSARVAQKLGARRRVHDRLVCGWMHGRANPTGTGAGFTFVEAVPEGWWYTAPLPNGRRVLAFHTDADLSDACLARDRESLFERTKETRELSAILRDCGFVLEGASGFTAAHSAVLAPSGGTGWLAAGDAALSLDPLAAQGLFNALFTGLAAAEAADRYLSGTANALGEYEQMIKRMWDGYRRDLATWYAVETRWPDAPFWRRRQHYRDASTAAATG